MEEKAKLVPGDVVRLKSGGPWMTVVEVYENGNLSAIWFPKNDGLPEEKYFAVWAVVKES